MSVPRIVDAHMHLGCGDFFTHDADLPGILRLMDRLGIERAYSTHFLWLSARFTEAVEASRRGYGESGGRIPFLAVFDPRFPGESLAAMDACAGREGLVGIKIHPSWHGVRADDGRYRAAWEYARDRGLPILSHTWSDTYNPVQKLSLPGLFEPFVARYPGVRFVLAHSGGPGNGQAQAVALVRTYPHTYLDTAGDLFFHGFLPFLVRQAGADRILFGTDQPMMDPRCQMVRTFLADIDAAAQELILGRNALKVFEPHLLEDKEG
jgi:uncharacterized protein